jgi:hypothetical protein
MPAPLVAALVAHCGFFRAGGAACFKKLRLQRKLFCAWKCNGTQFRQQRPTRCISSNRFLSKESSMYASPAAPIARTRPPEDRYSLSNAGAAIHVAHQSRPVVRTEPKSIGPRKFLSRQEIVARIKAQQQAYPLRHWAYCERATIGAMLDMAKNYDLTVQVHEVADPRERSLDGMSVFFFLGDRCNNLAFAEKFLSPSTRIVSTVSYACNFDCYAVHIYQCEHVPLSGREEGGLDLLKPYLPASGNTTTFVFVHPDHVDSLNSSLASNKTAFPYMTVLATPPYPAASPAARTDEKKGEGDLFLNMITGIGIATSAVLASYIAYLGRNCTFASCRPTIRGLPTQEETGNLADDVESQTDAASSFAEATAAVSNGLDNPPTAQGAGHSSTGRYSVVDSSD